MRTDLVFAGASVCNATLPLLEATLFIRSLHALDYFSRLRSEKNSFCFFLACRVQKKLHIFVSSSSTLNLQKETMCDGETNRVGNVLYDRDRHGGRGERRGPTEVWLHAREAGVTYIEGDELVPLLRWQSRAAGGAEEGKEEIPPTDGGTVHFRTVSEMSDFPAVVVVDARDDDVVGGHIPGALHVPEKDLHGMLEVIHATAMRKAEERSSVCTRCVVVFHCMESAMRGPRSATVFANYLYRLERRNHNYEMERALEKSTKQEEERCQEEKKATEAKEGKRESGAEEEKKGTKAKEEEKGLGAKEEEKGLGAKERRRIEVQVRVLRGGFDQWVRRHYMDEDLVESFDVGYWWGE